MYLTEDKVPETASIVACFEIPYTHAVAGPTFEGVALLRTDNGRWIVRRYNDRIKMWEESFPSWDGKSAHDRHVDIAKDLMGEYGGRS